MKTRSWWLVSVFCLSVPVSAASLFKPVEVADAELATLRGKYVLPDRVIHFGVTMSTVWHNSAGDSIGAQVSLQLNGNAQPSLFVSFIDQTGDGSTPVTGTGQVLGGNGLTQVQGISQSVRSAGDFNDAVNDLSITVSSGGTAQPAANGQPWTGGTQFTNPAGTVLVSSDGGGLRVMLNATGQGSAEQHLGAGSVRQQASLHGSLNNVRNLAALNVALRERPLTVDLAQCTWEQLRALRPIGY